MKKKWIILAVLTALLLAAYLYLHFRKSKDFEPAIKEKLSSMVSTATRGLYKLDIEHIEIDVTGGSVEARNIFLMPDSAVMERLEQSKRLGNNIFSVYIKKVLLDGLSPADLLDQSNIHLEQLVIDSPEVKITHKKRAWDNNDTMNLYDQISNSQQSYTLDRLLLNNIRLSVTDLDKDRQVNSFKNLSAAFADIRIDSTALKDSSRFLLAKDAVIYIKGYHVETKEKLYQFNVDSVALKPMIGLLRFYKLALIPFGNREAFGKRIKFMKDMYDIRINEGTVKNINWYDLVSGEGLYGDEMELKGGYVHVFDDRSLPQANEVKVGKYPHQLLMKAPLPVEFPAIRLKDIDIVYEEFNPKSGKTGRVEFDGTDAVVNNVTNLPESIRQNGVLRIAADTRFMNAGKLHADFRLMLNQAEKGVFEVDAELGAMDGVRINPTTENLALVKVNKGSVDHLDVQLRGDNVAAGGNIRFLYHDLSVDLLKADDDGKIKKKKIISFIADKLLIKNANPAGGDDEPRTYSMQFKRDIHKSFFNLLWKTIMEGLKKTVKR